MRTIFALRSLGCCPAGHWHFEIWWKVIIKGDGFEMATWANEDLKVELS